MLPVPTVDARMRRLIGEHGIDTVWFGAAAPLGLLAARARHAGAKRVLASTHGHEVGWSMLPGARSVLRRIGDDSDVVTYVSRYTRGRFASAFGPKAALEHLPPGVDTDRFRPDPASRSRDARPLRTGAAAHRGVPVPAGAAQGSGHADPGAAVDQATGGRRRAGHRRRRTVSRHAARAGRGSSASPITSPSPAEFRPPICPPITRWLTCSPCRVAPAAPGWTSRDSASCSWKHRRPGYRSSPDPPAGHQKLCDTTRLGWWSTAVRCRRSPTPSASCWPTRIAPPRWAPPAASGSPRSGGGTTWPGDCPSLIRG